MEMKPVFLLADSELLFFWAEGAPFVGRIREYASVSEPRIVYLSRDDKEAQHLYEMVYAAFAQVGMTDCCPIGVEIDDRDLDHLEDADIIILAGGVWEALVDQGLCDLLRSRQEEGAVLVGIGEGAIQLGAYCWEKHSDDEMTVFEGIGAVPGVVSVDEDEDWQALRTVTPACRPRFRGFGIPQGGGLIYLPEENRFEPIREVVYETVERYGASELMLLIPR